MPPLRKPATAAPAEPPPSRPEEASREDIPTVTKSKSSQSPPASRRNKRRLRPRGEARLEPPVASEHAALEIDAERCPTLQQIGRNLSLAAARGELDSVIGREAEIERALEVLAKRHANSALLLGPAGVGKSSVARGIAIQLAAECQTDAPQVLVELPLGELLAGTGARGSLAERINTLRAELREEKGRVVLLVDEIHELFAAGADELMSELKAGMACGELTLVGTTTAPEYRRCIENDPVLARRFSVVEVSEPSEADAFLVLREVCQQLGGHHDVDYSDEAVAVAVSWSIRYLPGRALPDKAVALLDLAGARVRRRRVASESDDGKQQSVLPAHIAEVVSELAEVPIDRLMQTDHQRMVALDELLAERVVGHSEACSRIAAVLRRNAAGLRGRRPVGTFLLLGPTGVGKTETAKAVAELLFHSADAMTRLDMSEYAEAHSVARLIGAPPGYVGHEAGGLLTEAVRKRPYQVILLDEIEKAHIDVLESFLQVFDEGRLTDGRGRTVSFDNTVLVLTSNLGAEQMRKATSRRRVGFGSSEHKVQDSELSRVALDAARAALPPELYNRIDEVIFFAPLAREAVAAIAGRLLSELEDSLAARQVILDVDEAVIDALMDQGGYDPELGARPMRRTIVRLIEAPLADMLLRGELSEGSVVLVSLDRQGSIVLDAVDDAAASRTA